MRGDDRQQQELVSYGDLEERIGSDHPLRRIRTLADAALTRLGSHFDAIYGDVGRPSIAPEKLLRAMLLLVPYSVRSERALMDQMNLHLGFRWFVGLSLSDPVWDASTFSKNRERLLGGDIAVEFLTAVLAEARSRHWLSDERFTVDGTLIDAWASMRSYQPAAGQQLVKHCLVEFPRAVLIGVCQGRTDRSPLHSQRPQLSFGGRQTSTDFPQRLGSAYLAKQHRHELIPAGEATCLPLGLMLPHQGLELQSREQSQQLGWLQTRAQRRLQIGVQVENLPHRKLTHYRLRGVTI